MVLAAAVPIFARTGYLGSSVQAIAAASGISESYVFRLYGDKQALFLAALRHCFDRIREALDMAAEGASPRTPAAVLRAMAEAYAHLVTERDLLMIQVQALAASNDPLIRAELLQCERELVDFVASHSRAGDAALQNFFARGQLCHLITALEIDGNSEGQWAATLTKGIRHLPPRAPS